MQQPLRDHAYLFTANLIYALSFTLAKDIVPSYLSPSAAILVRVSITAFLYLLLEQLWVRQRLDPNDRLRVWLCGLFGVALNQLLFFEGLALTAPINAALIMTTTPILVLLLSALFRDEAFTWLKLIGVLSGAAGAVLILWSGKQLIPHGQGWLGDVLILLNAASYAVYLVMVKPLLYRYHPLLLLSRVFLIGLVFVAPVGLSGLLHAGWNSFPLVIWIELAFIVFFTTFLTYWFNMKALVRSNPSLVGIYIYLQPLLATTIALLLNRDRYPPLKIAATVLIFAGVYLVSQSRQNQRHTTLRTKNVHEE
ncbi:MAG: DMT family transporter [Chitinophagales bacterium]|nr:DMT family transporter [Chitinophagales bacterium]MDW8428600.1 DMT family transporter [Chitinophagales bacterium]